MDKKKKHIDDNYEPQLTQMGTFYATQSTSLPIVIWDIVAEYTNYFPICFIISNKCELQPLTSQDQEKLFAGSCYTIGADFIYTYNLARHAIYVPDIQQIYLLQEDEMYSYWVPQISSNSRKNKDEVFKNTNITPLLKDRKWEKLALLHFGQFGNVYKLFVLDNHVICLQRVFKNNIVSLYVQEYDKKCDIWHNDTLITSQLKNQPKVMFDDIYVPMQDKLYVFGSARGNPGPKSVFVFTLKTGLWSYLPDIPALPCNAWNSFVVPLIKNTFLRFDFSTRHLYLTLISIIPETTSTWVIWPLPPINPTNICSIWVDTFIDRIFISEALSRKGISLFSHLIGRDSSGSISLEVGCNEEWTKVDTSNLIMTVNTASPPF